VTHNSGYLDLLHRLTRLSHTTYLYNGCLIVSSSFSTYPAWAAVTPHVHVWLRVSTDRQVACRCPSGSGQSTCTGAGRVDASSLSRVCDQVTSWRGPEGLGALGCLCLVWWCARRPHYDDGITWYNVVLTSRVHSSVKYSQQSQSVVSYNGGISVLNHCLSWSKFVNTHLYHSRQWFNIHDFYSNISLVPPIATMDVWRGIT